MQLALWVNLSMNYTTESTLEALLVINMGLLTRKMSSIRSDKRRHWLNDHLVAIHMTYFGHSFPRYSYTLNEASPHQPWDMLLSTYYLVYLFHYTVSASYRDIYILISKTIDSKPGC
jgi:hypothetical protein